MNEGTFERRIHQGVDKARNREEQGELYGVQNLFRFDPMGTVSKNVRRLTEKRDKLTRSVGSGATRGGPILARHDRRRVRQRGRSGRRRK